MNPSRCLVFASLITLIVQGRSSAFEERMKDEVTKRCAAIESLLLSSTPVANPSARLPAKPEESAIRAFVRGLRDFKADDNAGRLKRTELLAKDDAFVTRLINDLPDASIGTLWSQTARVKITVDQDPARFYGADDILGSLAERQFVSRLFSLAAKHAETKNDPNRASQIRRASVRYYVADPMDLGGMVTNLRQAASRRNTTVAALVGIDDSTKADQLSTEIEALATAWNAGADLLAPASIASDRAIKQLGAGAVNPPDLDQAIDEIESFWSKASPNNTSVSWFAANMMYRIRSMVALRGTQEQLAKIDTRIDQLIEAIDIQPQKRWMMETKTVAPVAQSGAGVVIVSDPNSPQVKGTPPQ